MGVNSTARKSQQLGMPWGTAVNRLRKTIIFHLLQQLGDNKCYRCGEWILDESEMSVEHKEPWLDVSPDLFWNMDNVTFSHRTCNRPNRPNWQDGLAAAHAKRNIRQSSNR